MTRYKPLLLAFLVIGLAVIGLSFTTIWANTLRPKAASDLESELQHGVKSGQGAAGGGWEQIDASLRFHVEHPSSVVLDDAFIVSATCDVADATAYAVTVGPRFDSKRPLDYSKDKLSDRVQALFGGPEIGSKPKAGIELVMAGAEIAPSTPQTGSLRTPLSWSVRSHTKGKLQGFVRVRWLEEVTDPGERWELHVDEDSYFTVDVTDRIWNFENFTTWVARFVGTLLTLPGILLAIGAAFGKKKAAEPPRSRLILPDSDGF
jgi:hypothetical protein